MTTEEYKVTLKELTV